MLFKSQVYTQASGSIGGTTYSRSPSGMYTRARAMPVNPQTARQIAVRNAMSMYSQMWHSALTQVQRDQWDVYAEQVLLTNRLGDQFQGSGQNHFIRANVPRSQANDQLTLATALTPILNAPTTYLLPTIGTIDVTAISAAADLMQVAFDDSAPWVNNPENAILIYMGRPRTASRKFFKGPYRIVGVIQGDAGAPPTSPATITPLSPAYTTTGGQVVKSQFTLSVGNAANEPTGLSGKTLSEMIVVA